MTAPDTPPPPAAPPGALRQRVQWVGLVLGPLLAGIAWAAIPEAAAGGLSPGGRATAAVAVWMACWWLTEALPLAATALLPLVAFPLLGVAPVEEAAAPYSRSLIFLFMGGFILGLGMQRWGLHRRIALATLLVVGAQPARLVAGFMLATAFLSMWISNTATVIMMLPIGLSVLELYRERAAGAAQPPEARELAGFGTALMLGIAYAASIGGIGTLVGTPPNLVLASFVRQRYGIEVGMLEWMRIGLPVVAVMLPLTWLFLIRVAHPLRLPAAGGGRRLIREQLQALGPPSRGERAVAVIFGLTAAGWILRPTIVAWSGLTGLSDAGIAMSGALALFVVPVEARARRFVMDWDTAGRLPWGILILFGGGLSLAAAIARHGVDAWIAQAFGGLAGAPLLLVALAVCTVVVFLTEITSNTAVTTTLLPVLAASAVALGVPPGLLLTTAAIAASCAFMLPVATPPNAIVFASGYVSAAQMARAGLGLNLLAILVISLLLHLTGSRLVVAGG